MCAQAQAAGQVPRQRAARLARPAARALTLLKGWPSSGSTTHRTYMGTRVQEDSWQTARQAAACTRPPPPPCARCAHLNPVAEAQAQLLQGQRLLTLLLAI